MRLGTLDRRAVMAGLATMAAGKTAYADQPARPLAHGALAQNPLAQIFEPVAIDLPDVKVWGLNGKRDISELKGRAVLMPLWAEWCGPCMSELPDFARLQRKYGNDRFAIIPVLTATQRKFTPETLQHIMAMMHCDVFEPLIENWQGDRLLSRMGRYHGEAALPCNLIIAPDGHVVAREIGRANSDDPDQAKTYKEMLARVAADSVQSLWGQQPGEEFAKAMADGFLT